MHFPMVPRMSTNICSHESMSHLRCSLPSTKSNRTSDFVSYSVSLWQKSTELGARTSRPQIVEFPKLSKSCGQMVACQRSGGRRKQGHARPCRDGGWNERIKFSMDRVEKYLDAQDMVAESFVGSTNLRENPVDCECALRDSQGRRSTFRSSTQ